MTLLHGLLIVSAAAWVITAITQILILKAIRATKRRLTMATADVQAAVQALQAEVAQDTSVVNSAVTFIAGIEAQLANIPQPPTTDPATTQAISDLQTSLAANRVALANAIATNTPAASQVQPVPAPAAQPAADPASTPAQPAGGS